MVMQGISLYILLGHLFIARVGSECVPFQCLKCDPEGEGPVFPIECSPCEEIACKKNISSICKIDFQVSINSPKSNVDEGDTITLTCVLRPPKVNLTFEWMKDGNLIEDQNESNLTLKEVLTLNAGQYICRVNFSCGSYESLPQSVIVNNGSVVILVICGVSAVVLVMIMGLAMKFKMKRDNAKHRERRNRRGQVGQTGGPSPITPRES